MTIVIVLFLFPFEEMNKSMLGNDLIRKITEKAKTNISTPSNSNTDLIVLLPLSSVKPHPKNREYFSDLDAAMKDSLIEDMRENGQINPIIVNKNTDCTYTVLAGHQRLIAAERLSWQQIKAIVMEVSELEAEKLLIRDNLFRRHMGGMELARAIDAYARLSDNQTTKSIRQIADEIGENRNTVHFYMKLNNLIPELQKLIDEKKLTVTAAQAFTSMDEEEQRRLFHSLGDSITALNKKELVEEIKRQCYIEVEDGKGQKKKAKTALSKLNSVESIIASVCSSSIDICDSQTLSVLDEKLKAISSSLSVLSDSVSAAIQGKHIDAAES